MSGKGAMLSPRTIRSFQCSGISRTVARLEEPSTLTSMPLKGWQIASGSGSIVVAILDSGIDFVHPEFQGRILPGYDFVNEDDDPQADNSHGVFVAGILGANANDGFGVAGLDHSALLLPIKVLNAQNSGTTMDLAQGLIFAAGAHVINMSLINYPLSATLLSALQYARNAGSVLVACAGNGGIGNADLSGPGASPLTISVGATDHNDLRASFSGTGMALDVVAPGLSISTVTSDRSKCEGAVQRLFRGYANRFGNRIHSLVGRSSADT
jgi:thermitase